MATIKKEMRLGDALVSLKTGLNPRDNFQLNTADANNWYITVRELSGVAIDFLPQTDKVNDFALCLINNRSNLEVGDVLFSGTGSIGKTAIIREKPLNWNIKEGVYTLKPKKNILDSYFLLLLLQYYSKTNIFLKLSAGSTVFSVPMQSLANFKINLPDLPTQKSIAKVLSDLDAKIELNNKINRELEAMAKTLYDYWFVQFDFPDANGRPYKSSGGKMVYNAELKREIPEGWEVKKLGDIIKKYADKSTHIESKNILNEGSYPVITQDNGDLISGFTNENNPIEDVPLIVFGDHSCTLRYIDFPFFRGADGTQIMYFEEDLTIYVYLFLQMIITQIP